MVFCLCFGLRPKRNKVVQKPKMKPVSVQESICDQPSSSSARVSSDPEALLPPSRTTENFTYQQLATATNNFNLDSRIGQGGFGDVYKGKLKINGQITFFGVCGYVVGQQLTDVAIKMLNQSSKQGNQEFIAEVLMLSIFRNKNLVKLYGYCCQGDHRSLVYEYMPLGSLEDNIHNFNYVQDALDLTTRMNIALGAAKGLAYLHDEAQPSVIYRDMKTANILLDHEFQPKLSDFGLAKLGPGEGISHVTTRVMGTVGYCAPEYAATGKLTMKSDIYSFGVVLLELITGRKPIGDSTMGAQRLLVKWALPYFWSRNISQITDPKLAIQGHSYWEEAVRRALQLACMCVRDNAKARPSIREVVKALEVIVEDIVRKHKGKSTQYRGGVDKGKKSEGSTVSEEDEGLERERDLADAKRWAEGLRDKQKKSNKPPKPIR